MMNWGEEVGFMLKLGIANMVEVLHTFITIVDMLGIAQIIGNTQKKSQSMYYTNQWQ